MRFSRASNARLTNQIGAHDAGSRHTADFTFCARRDDTQFPEIIIFLFL
jgi:hypothetical protein